MTSRDEVGSAGAARGRSAERSSAARARPTRGAAARAAVVRAAVVRAAVVRAAVAPDGDVEVAADDGHAQTTTRDGDVKAASSSAAVPVSCNEVRLVGRVSGAPQPRELPSGDSLVGWRVVVERPEARRRSPAGVRSPTVDTLDCVAWTPGLRRTASALRDGDVVEVTGALRRRFWRAGAAVASRTEVEAEQVRRVSRRSSTG